MDVGGLPDRLRSVARTHAGRTAVVSDDESLTYGALLGRVQASVRDLRAHGVGRGDRVALLLENSPEFVIAYLGALAAGAVVVPLNHQYRQLELQAMLDECTPSILVARPESRSLCEAVVAACGRSCQVRYTEPWTSFHGADEEAGWPAAPIDAHAPVMLQFSSGSTGRPKQIARTHAQLMFELDGLTRAVGLSCTDRVLGAAPFSHVNGLTRSLLASLWVGASLYPVASYDRHATADLIDRARLSVFIAVPFMFSTLAQTNFRRPPDFSSLRLCVSASAPMPQKFNRLFHEKFGMYVRQLYGSTETGTISVNLGADIEHTLESVGTPLDGVVVDVFDDDRRRMAADQTGELAVSSPGAIAGYAAAAASDQEAFHDGYFFTGDLGRKDADGNLYLVGRKKFVINKGGFKIDPREVEEVLESHPMVEEAVVVAAPSPYGDDRVKAVIVRRGACTEAEIAAHCRGRIADFKVPSLVEFRESLPKTATGKIRRALLVEGDHGA